MCTAVAVSLALALISAAEGQTLSLADKRVVDAARHRYYNMELSGFKSMSCSISFDFATLPPIFSADPETLALLRRTNFTLTLDRANAKVQYTFPSGASAQAKDRATQPSNLLRSFPEGVFQTWLSKGLNGPVPPFDSEIQSVTSKPYGYLFELRVPGAPVEVLLNSDYVAKEIVSMQGKLHEKPTYKPSAKGLILTGTDALDETQPSGPTQVVYSLQTTEINGIEAPSAVHLKVNDNIDAKFALSSCDVKKALVIKVSPPPSIP